MKIRRIGALSLGKMLGGLYLLMGLVFGAIFSLTSLLGFAMIPAEEGGGALIGLLFGLGAVIVLPIFYGVMGFLGGLLVAVIYNLVAGLFGGIELEVDLTASSAPPAG